MSAADIALELPMHGKCKYESHWFAAASVTGVEGAGALRVPVLLVIDC